MHIIQDVRWFCGQSNIGIVRVNDEYEGIRYYIGSFEPSDDDMVDAAFIAAWGSSFPKAAGDILFGVVGS